MKRICFFFIVAASLLLNISYSFSINVTVTNTNDNGTGSLRDAINITNFSFGTFDTIKFNIPLSDLGYNAASGVWTIVPDSTLPVLWGGQTTIDGTTQTTNQGNTNLNGPEVAIDGSNTLDYGFTIVSAANQIKGLIIGQFNYGVVIDGSMAGDNAIVNNYIGVNYNGTSAWPNNYGIAIADSSVQNFIRNNIISGNIAEGIIINESDQNILTGNFIGTNASGTIAIANGDGILMNVARHTTIGGPFAMYRNIISGNLNSGIIINGSGTYHNLIVNNYIGTDVTGMFSIANYTGIMLKSQANGNYIGGNTSSYRNIISGNYEIGIYVESSDSNIIVGNFVGPDATGNGAIMNANGDSLCQGNGIEINTVSKYNTIGGYNAGEGNVISGNRVYGFIYYGNVSHNPLIGNYIGTNATGTAPLSNATGICVDGGSNHNLMANNLLSGNISYGIFIVTTGTGYNELKGNLIGTNAAGTDTIPNDIGLVIAGGTQHNVIGGNLATDRNIISGNRYDGIEIADQHTDSNSVIGNYIGTDINGTSRLGNSIGIGIATNPKHTLISGNVISGNKRMGMVLYEFADSNKIISNKIGTAVNGTSDLGNGSAGIAIAYGPKWNIVGEPGAGNIIAYNDSSGVLVADSASKYNKISANSMWGNFVLGIEIFPPLVNPNDAGDNDTGPNDMMNSPVITSSEYHSFGNYTVVRGTLDTHQPQLCTVELFKAAANLFNCGDGKTFLGFVIPDNAGNWCDTLTGVVNGDLITTTATDELMNTSEFSANKTTTMFVGIDESSLSRNSFDVYPNPFDNSFTIVYNIENPCNVEIMLFNMNGQYIATLENNMKKEGVQKAEIDMRDLVSGVYYVRAITGKTAVTRKIIKTN